MRLYITEYIGSDQKRQDLMTELERIHHHCGTKKAQCGPVVREFLGFPSLRMLPFKLPKLTKENVYSKIPEWKPMLLQTEKYICQLIDCKSQIHQVFMEKEEAILYRDWTTFLVSTYQYEKEKLATLQAQHKVQQFKNPTSSRKKKIGSGFFGSVYFNQENKSVSKRSSNVLYHQLQLHKRLYQLDPKHIVKPLSHEVTVIPSSTWKEYFDLSNYNSIGDFINKQYQMQYLDGKDGWYTMEEALTRTDWSLAKKKKCITDLEQAIKILHQNFIVHNDIHAGNVMVNVNTNRIKLLDFGMALEYTEKMWKQICKTRKPLHYYDILKLELLKERLDPDYKATTSYDILAKLKSNCDDIPSY